MAAGEAGDLGDELRDLISLLVDIINEEVIMASEGKNVVPDRACNFAVVLRTLPEDLLSMAAGDCSPSGIEGESGGTSV